MTAPGEKRKEENLSISLLKKGYKRDVQQTIT